MSGLDLYADFEPLIPFGEEIDFLHKIYIEKLRERGVKNILDIGCGNGNFLSLAKKNSIGGKGIDLSEKMTLIAREKGINAQKIALEEESGFYDAATAVFDVVNYIHPRDLTAFFNAAKNRLSARGAFIFDVNTLYGFTEIACGSIVLEKGGLFGAARSDYIDGILINDFDLFTKKGETYKRDSWKIEQFYHSDRAIEESLKKSGFAQIAAENINLYGEDSPDKKLYIAERAEQ